jgi:hypothetical protein
MAVKRALQANTVPANAYTESLVPATPGIKDTHETSLSQIAPRCLSVPDAQRQRVCRPEPRLDDQLLDEVGFAEPPPDAVLEVALVEALGLFWR